jgi:DNA-directed RNA polymerase subunit RPC12/RpoP
MRHILSGMDETRISKCKRCSENLGSLATGCHPRYMLPITHHEVQENLGILSIRGRSRILYKCSRCRRLLQLELVNMSLEVINLIVSVRELKLMLLHLLLIVL